MRRTLYIIGLFLLTSFSLHAQEETSVNNEGMNNEAEPYEAPISYMFGHHLSMNIGGGLHTMMSNPANGHWEKGFGGLFEAKYQYIPKHIGFSGGLKLTMRNGFTTANYTYNARYTHPGNGQICTLTASFNDLKERESMWAIEMPLQLLIASSTNKSWNFLAALGAAVSLPFTGKYKVVDGSFSTTGKFEQTQMTELEYLSDYGFRTYYPDDTKSDKIKYNLLGLNAIVDLGLLHNIKEEMGIYFGIYGTYGLLNACKENDALPYNGHNYWGLYNSKQVSKITPIEAGVKIGVFFSFHDTEREIDETNRILAERVDQERQEAEAAAAERAARVAERSRKQELEKAEQEKRARELAGVQEASRQEAYDALKAIKENAKFANINATPIFPSSTDKHFITLRKYLESNPDAKLILTGHTDNTGTPAKNFVNGQHRAEAFKTALVKKNIPRGRIGCVSKGETEPIADNDTPEGRAKNNRVEIDIVDQSGSIMNTNNEPLHNEDSEGE